MVPPNIAVVNAIIPTCLSDTPFVASTIFLRATPNKIREVLIITIAIDPFNICLFALFSILNVDVVIFTIPSINIEPNNAGTPDAATVARNKDDTAISPVTTVRERALFAATPIYLLLFDSFLTVGISLSIVFSKRVAPSNAGAPVIDSAVKNIVEANKFPTIDVMFFADLFASSNFSLFLFNKIDSDNIDFLPIKISLNFPIILFLIILFILHPTLDSDFIISGAEFISLIMLFKSFSSIFKSSFAFLNIFVMSFIFCFPTIISFSEMFFNLLNASIMEVNPLPLFCLFIFSTIAFATLSDALSLNFAMVGVTDLTCFNSIFARLSIAFLIPFVSSRIS